MFYKTHCSSPIGNITLASDGEHLIGLWFENQKYFCASPYITLIENYDFEIFDHTKIWLNKYFKGERPEINKLLLAPIGNSFQQSVWKILCEIPYGKTISYGDIAKLIAKQRGITKMSAQAIGGAVGRNPIPIIIPCHRVIGSKGKLTGYATGIFVKAKLLEHEKAKFRF
ncbi:MAG: methylated-DNA--[Alphaproteobacteria bacterium]|nr:methylated-DNA--[protein]-cysteine S-methyltransferase [Alphaproteobacteria bacterium]